MEMIFVLIRTIVRSGELVALFLHSMIAVYYTGIDVSNTLKQLAERRTDIFGKGGEETMIGKKVSCKIVTNVMNCNVIEYSQFVIHTQSEYLIISELCRSERKK